MVYFLHVRYRFWRKSLRLELGQRDCALGHVWRSHDHIHVDTEISSVRRGQAQTLSYPPYAQLETRYSTISNVCCYSCSLRNYASAPSPGNPTR